MVKCKEGNGMCHLYDVFSFGCLKASVNITNSKYHGRYTNEVNRARNSKTVKSPLINQQQSGKGQIFPLFSLELNPEILLPLLARCWVLQVCTVTTNPFSRSKPCPYPVISLFLKSLCVIFDVK